MLPYHDKININYLLVIDIYFLLQIDPADLKCLCESPHFEVTTWPQAYREAWSLIKTVELLSHSLAVKMFVFVFKKERNYREKENEITPPVWLMRI